MTYLSLRRGWSTMSVVLLAYVSIFLLSNAGCGGGVAAARFRTTSALSSINLLAKGIGKTPPMGWNSWNHFHCQIEEKLIRETADAMVSSGLAAIGYEYINLDDCWGELNRDSKVYICILYIH
ncbi:alpha-galactosidase-like [Carya illinoinensis]|uniref:alpha-galactosidase-like n=1 Tax=Carya illinoinensis TaxID=32201 RepID=UPI001C7266D5|nr:alpha-galactosidase-like [Carya illinoinensis]